MPKELSKDKLIAAALVSEGWQEDGMSGKARIFRKGDLMRVLWTSGIVRDSTKPVGSAKISSEEAAMWLAIGEAVCYAPASV